jgi:hypothetical protein
MMFLITERLIGLQNGKKNCILHLLTGRNIGGPETLFPDTPYKLAGKTASSA